MEYKNNDGDANLSILKHDPNRDSQGTKNGATN